MTNKTPTNEVNSAMKTGEAISPVENSPKHEPLTQAELDELSDIANGHTGRFTARNAERLAAGKETPGAYFEGGV